jgi:hypothetical protein
MRKLLQLVVVIAVLNVWGALALADGPALTAQPDVRPDTQSSTAGGFASASGGNAGPATVSSSEPITASSSNTTGPTAPSRGSTSATGPGTTATAPIAASQPNPSAPDGSAPAPTTSGPTADADASRTTVSTSDSRIQANAVATARAAFAGSLAGIGSAEDPTNASTCSTAEASPGVPTDVSLGTSCGSQLSSASEDFSANGADGNGAAGTPSGSACFLANASAGPSPTSDLSTTCTAHSVTSSPTATNTGNERAASTDSSAPTTDHARGLLGIESLPSTATAPASLALLGVTIGAAGLALLRRSRRKS